MSDSATPWTAACKASLFFTVSRGLLKFTSIELTILCNHLILSHPLLLLPSIFPSIRVFSNKLPLHIMWRKHWSCSISPSNEYSGLISFRIDWFDLLAVQGTLKSLLQHQVDNMGWLVWLQKHNEAIVSSKEEVHGQGLLDQWIFLIWVNILIPYKKLFYRRALEY